MKPTPLFLGNWKMHMLPDEAAQYMVRFVEGFSSAQTQLPDTGIAPPLVSIPAVSRTVSRDQGVLLGAQNVHWESSGAHTGEISPQMLTALGVDFVIIGHSERRQMYGENDAHVALRTKAALEHGLTAVVCVGETEQEYKSGKTTEIVVRQIKAALEATPAEHVSRLVVAYEPVWAIGTGLAATPEQACAVHELLRQKLVERFGPDQGASIRILYGGSTKPENIGELLSQPEVQGALVGGASLKPDVFRQLIENGRKAYWA